jgi:hypothetical protein
MYKILLGTDAGSPVLLLILKDHNFQRLRSAPLNDHIRVDCAPFRQPNVTVLLTYAANRNAARQYIRGGQFRETSTDGFDRRFAGSLFGTSIVGSVLTETTLQQFETQPMQKHITLKPKPDFTIDITYTNSDRAVVGFLRGMGISLEKITTDPELRHLRDLYAAETVDLAAKISAEHGISLPAEGPTKISYGIEGANEQVLLAVQGTDLAWFAQNPTEDSYYRRVVAGEFPTEITATWVKVMRRKNDPTNTRIRVPMTRDASGNFIEWKSTR